jgi:CspA family cold shock protein
MAVGNVKWFDLKKGYGFIQPEDGSKDVFVDLAALKRAGLAKLEEGQKVQYRVVEGRNGSKMAANLALTAAR